LMDYLDVHLFEQGTLLNSWKTGDQLPFRERPVDHENFVFPMTLNSDSEYRILIKATNTEAMELPLKLYERETFFVNDHQKAVINGIFFGFLIIMAAYNLVLYLNIREKSYLYYVMYVIGMLFYFSSQDGIVYQYFLPESPIAHHFAIPLIIIYTAHSIILFIRDFLDLDKNSPRGWTYIRILMVLNLIIGLSFFFISYRVGILLMCLVLALLSIAGLSVTTRLSLNGLRTAQILLAGWGVLLTFVIFMVLSKVGIIYNEFLASYGIKLGTTFEVLIFSFALSYRINLEKQEKEQALQVINEERKERIEAQANALRYEEEASKAKDMALAQQRKLNERLEELVSERTRQLEETLKDLEKSNRELEILGETDGLTKIFNRRAFDQKVMDVWQESVDKNKPFSLLLIDADHFKLVNDNRGHPCGDYVLVELAKLITECATRPTDLAFRYGGEEFLLVLPNTGASGAAYVAEALRSAAANHQMVWDDDPFHITISIGIHTFNLDKSETVEDIVAKADAALYHSKETGRNKSTASTEL